jgi:hypothetical protein
MPSLAKCMLVLLLPVSAFAQDPATDPTLLGAGARTRPVYDGSAAQHLEPVPVRPLHPGPAGRRCPL